MDWSYDVQCRNCGTNNSVGLSEIERTKCFNCRKPLVWTTRPETYKPNHVPLKHRILFALFGGLLFVVSLHAVVTQHLQLPYGNRWSRSYYEFSNWELVPPVVSLLLVATGAILSVADHYDRRNNEYGPSGNRVGVK